MKQVIKQAKRLGNASGVVLPKEWESALVQVKVIKKYPTNHELLKIITQEIELKDIGGVYLVGSMARGESDKNSDIDVLVISNHIDRDVIDKNIQITVVSKETLNQYKSYPLYYSMLSEAKTILNDGLLNEIRSDLTLSSKGIAEYLVATKNVLKKSHKILSGNKSKESTRTSDAIAYSLVLRLRGLHILDSYLKGKPPSKKSLLNLILKLTGSLEIYERYVAMKNDEELELESISIIDAKAIHNYLERGIFRWEETIKEDGRY